VIVSDFIINFLIKKKITDIFGIPGEIIFQFLYAADRRKPKINSHLNFHEQNSCFAAIGYARSSNKLGVAYATRGPGITNMVTAVADAYNDSVPIMVITAHAGDVPKNKMRVISDQEIDTMHIFKNITKYCARIDNVNDAQFHIEKAYFEAMNGRRGQVILDFNKKIFSKKISINKKFRYKKDKTSIEKIKKISNIINKNIQQSKSPIFLVGDGFRYTNSSNKLIEFSEKNKIPILSSRFCQDLFLKSKIFFGYFSSHGQRDANLILSKSDLIVSLGHRLLFLNNKSKSFKNAFQKKIIRIDIDAAELKRKVSTSINYNIKLEKIVNQLKNKKIEYINKSKWLNYCKNVKKKFFKEDLGYPITLIISILKNIKRNIHIISDVGNNEFWLCRAYAYTKCINPIIYSKSYGTMGSSIGKAIGTYYATKKPVMCFIGDQALQMLSSELQFIFSNKLPITIVLLNNSSSGMIRSKQKVRYGNHFIHTTLDSGYSTPNFSKIIKSYNIKYYNIKKNDEKKIANILKNQKKPKLIEVKINPNIELIPHIPIGNEFQNLSPNIKRN